MINQYKTIPLSTFVFGSNHLGVHGGGAAHYANKWRGAVGGRGEGPMGSFTTNEGTLSPGCYALPTKLTPHEQLTLDEVAVNVNTFLQYADDNPNIIFQVTRVGCGLAGFTDSDIAPMFQDAPPNCMLPGVWARDKCHSIARVIVAGSRGIDDREKVFSGISQWVRQVQQLDKFEIVSGLAAGPDSFAIEWAYANGFENQVVGVPALWYLYGRRAAGPIRNQLMSWYGTHLIAFWDGQSSGTRNMINTADRDGLEIKVIAC